jgi:hypothetical protein
MASPGRSSFHSVVLIKLQLLFLVCFNLVKVGPVLFLKRVTYTIGVPLA